jgi:hypothetical protein
MVDLSNPYNCQTCKHNKTKEHHWESKDAVHNEELGMVYCEKQLYSKWTQPSWFNCTGCASHSSMITAERVLDDLHEILLPYFQPDCPIYLDAITPGGRAVRLIFDYLRKLPQGEKGE